MKRYLFHSGLAVMVALSPLCAAAAVKKTPPPSKQTLPARNVKAQQRNTIPANRFQKKQAKTTGPITGTGMPLPKQKPLLKQAGLNPSKTAPQASPPIVPKGWQPPQEKGKDLYARAAQGKRTLQPASSSSRFSSRIALTPANVNTQPGAGLTPAGGLRQDRLLPGRGLLGERADRLNSELATKAQTFNGRLAGSKRGDGEFLPEALPNGKDVSSERPVDSLLNFDQRGGGRTAFTQAQDAAWSQRLPGFSTLQLNVGGRRADPRSSSTEEGHGGVADVSVVKNDGKGNAVVTTTYNDGTVVVQREVNDGESVHTTTSTSKEHKDGSTSTTTTSQLGGSTTTESITSSGDKITSKQVQNDEEQSGFHLGHIITNEGNDNSLLKWRGRNVVEGVNNGTVRTGTVDEKGAIKWDNKKKPGPVDDGRMVDAPAIDRTTYANAALAKFQLREEGMGRPVPNRDLSREALLRYKTNPNPDAPAKETGPPPAILNPLTGDRPDDLPTATGPRPKPNRGDVLPIGPPRK